MKFLEIFIEKPRVLLLTLAFIILAGVSSVLSLPIQENPELAQRWGSVTTTYPGATPERIETQVVDQLERKLREVTDIDELDSIISQGFATTVVEFSQELDPELIEQTWSQVQDKMSLVEPFLPEGATISLVRSSGPPITNLYAIKWQGKDEPRFVMMSRIAEQLQTRLNSLDLTEKLRVFGAADEELSIKVDPSKLHFFEPENGHTISNSSFQVDDVEVIPIKIGHGKFDIHAFRIGDISYITDANHIEPEEIDKIRGSKIIVLNALRTKPHHSHFTLQEALEVLEELQPEKAYLTHISHLLGKHEDVSKQLPDWAELAFDGLRVG